MKIKALIIVLSASWLMLGLSSCRTQKGCDCPTFGGHSITKTGTYKTNGSNHRNQ